MTIADNIRDYRNSMPDGVKLVAVSKFHPAEALQEAYDAGQRIFGESRMQEIDDKHKLLPEDVEWHFIGHLQRNKVKLILPYTYTIHSVDSIRLFDEIVVQATEIKKRVCCLLQVHIADEDSKYGFSMKECIQFLDSDHWKNSKFAYIGGVMGMATNTDDENQIRKEFESLRQFFDQLKTKYFQDTDEFREVSMGMSNDYKLAIEEGSTMVRIGSSIFGDREY